MATRIWRPFESGISCYECLLSVLVVYFAELRSGARLPTLWVNNWKILKLDYLLLSINLNRLDFQQLIWMWSWVNMWIWFVVSGWSPVLFITRTLSSGYLFWLYQYSLSLMLFYLTGILDIPVHNNRIHALHVLFTLFSEFKNSQVCKQTVGNLLNCAMKNQPYH